MGRAILNRPPPARDPDRNSADLAWTRYFFFGAVKARFVEKNGSTL